MTEKDRQIALSHYLKLLPQTRGNEKKLVARKIIHFLKEGLKCA